MLKVFFVPQQLFYGQSAGAMLLRRKLNVSIVRAALAPLNRGAASSAQEFGLLLPRPLREGAGGWGKLPTESHVAIPLGLYIFGSIPLGKQPTESHVAIPLGLYIFGSIPLGKQPTESHVAISPTP